MIKKLIFIFIGLLPLITVAQEEQKCDDLYDYAINSSSLWYNTSPNDHKPLKDITVCSYDAESYATTCFKKFKNFDDIKSYAANSLKQIEKCFNTRNSNIKQIDTATASHFVVKLDDFEYRKQLYSGSLRIQKDKEGYFFIYQTKLKQIKIISPEKEICTTIETLLNDDSAQKDWVEWQGLFVEKWDGADSYVCAKIPYALASRNDCKVEIYPNVLKWTSRWFYGMAHTANINNFAEGMADTINSCVIGGVVTKGVQKQRIDYVNKMTRIDIEGSRNEAGRGPSVTVQITRWKN